MKKLFLLMLILLALPAAAENLIYYQDSAATDTLRMIPVSDITPLPTSALVTIGSVTVDPAAPVSENDTDIISATAVAQNVTSLANRKSVNFVNHSSSVTCWLTMDTVTASAAVGVGIPLFPYGFWGVELDSSKVVGVMADGVASVTVYQDGY